MHSSPVDGHSKRQPPLKFWPSFSNPDHLHLVTSLVLEDREQCSNSHRSVCMANTALKPAQRTQ